MDAHARVCPVPLVNANPARALTREIATSDWVDLADNILADAGPFTPRQREVLIEVMVQLERHVTAYG